MGPLQLCILAPCSFKQKYHLPQNTGMHMHHVLRMILNQLYPDGNKYKMKPASWPLICAALSAMSSGRFVFSFVTGARMGVCHSTFLRTTQIPFGRFYL